MKKLKSFSYHFHENENSLDPIEKKLLKMANEARSNAYAPYSDFLVGCAILFENGEIITGNNQENAAYPSGLCAERTAIFWAGSQYPNLVIKKLFVVAGPKSGSRKPPVPPCGSCRQSIMEYEKKQAQPIEIYFASLSGEIIKTNSINDLLPFSFDQTFL